MKNNKWIHPFSVLIITMLLSSCEPISIKEYQMEPYNGAFTWEEVTKKAAWSNRYDHAAVAFDGKLWVFGGYDSGRIRSLTWTLISCRDLTMFAWRLITAGLIICTSSAVQPCWKML